MVINSEEIQWEGLFPRSSDNAELADFAELVPEYRPSAYLRERLEAAVT